MKNDLEFRTKQGEEETFARGFDEALGDNWKIYEVTFHAPTKGERLVNGAILGIVQGISFMHTLPGYCKARNNEDVIGKDFHSNAPVRIVTQLAAMFGIAAGYYALSKAGCPEALVFPALTQLFSYCANH